MSYIDHKKLKNLIKLNKLSNTNRILNHDLIKQSKLKIMTRENGDY